MLHGLGYTTLAPTSVVAKSKEELRDELPSAAVLADWRSQRERAQESAAHAKSEAAKAFWTERERTLAQAFSRRGECCATQASLAGDK
jgi:hypothetical protein